MKKSKSILESKAIEEIWPSIPEKFRARWEAVYKTFLYHKKRYKKARKHINGLRKHATIDQKFLSDYAKAKEYLLVVKKAFDDRRKSLNKLSLKLFTNVPVDKFKKEEKAKKVLEPFTVVLNAQQLTLLAQSIQKCLENWPKNVNRVSLQFDEGVAYHTYAVSEDADDSKKTFVTSKKGN